MHHGAALAWFQAPVGSIHGPRAQPPGSKGLKRTSGLPAEYFRAPGILLFRPGKNGRGFVIDLQGFFRDKGFVGPYRYAQGYRRYRGFPVVYQRRGPAYAFRILRGKAEYALRRAPFQARGHLLGKLPVRSAFRVRHVVGALQRAGQEGVRPSDRRPAGVVGA